MVRRMARDACLHNEVRGERAWVRLPWHDRICDGLTGATSVVGISYEISFP